MKKYLSLLSLLLANMIPIYGVIYSDWSVFNILLLYWSESLIIGFYNVLKMLRIQSTSVVVVLPFFLFHYGTFMFVHLIFLLVFMMTSGEVLKNISSLPLAFMSLFISHGISFQTNFVSKKEFERRSVFQQMFQPYQRIMVMHITIVFGGFFVISQGETLSLLFLLVGIKMILDAWAHIREHSLFQTFS